MVLSEARGLSFVDTDTGELQERRLEHREEAERFYRELEAQGLKVRVGMEASGHARWFERLLAELQFELWIGDAAEIRAKRVRKQKTDRQDAQLILRLLLENRFPQVWVPGWENRDLRQLLWHRHRMVQARTRIMNQLQAVALNEGVRCKKQLWRDAGREQLQSFKLAPWASRRRRDLLELLDRLTPTIAELTQAIEQEADKWPEAQRLQTHPGVGALTALAFVLIIARAVIDATEGAQAVRWLEFPAAVLLLLIITGVSQSGAFYVLDRKSGNWLWVDFEDEQYGGYGVKDFDLLVHEYDFLSLMERPAPLAGGPGWLLEPGKSAEMTACPCN